MHYLVTGAAGFIGFHVAERLLKAGFDVTGVDNLNDYYDVSLKEARLERLRVYPSFTFHFLDLADRIGMNTLFSEFSFDRVIHLGAQAGVRYSIDNPHTYADANLVGHLNVLEGCRSQQVSHLVYASSSSVYGLNTDIPFKVADSVDHPISLYAATKKANELMSHSYAHLYNLPCTGLRFFTVYGPWGRPDMALFKFTKAILDGDAIDVYNEGNMQRDFTYIDDIVESIIRIAEKTPLPRKDWKPGQGNAGQSSAPYRVFNIGAGHSIKLTEFIEAIENATGKHAKRNMMPMQPGDVPATWAETEDLYNAIDYRPKVSVQEGVNNFVKWYREFYQI
ncbi:NAD-dependent epimerase [Gallaecimonas mangrovi]|uniref:NAD-dependent epimerase n=1 Tax=Gallaecimonas mangrovi TaxID=2291597 RepID=UPI000E20BA6C|nr:NAD-dependent epimerase [Gallaecimonas mangrovi]